MELHSSRPSPRGLEVLRDYLALAELADFLQRQGHADLADRLADEAREILRALLCETPKP